MKPASKNPPPTKKGKKPAKPAQKDDADEDNDVACQNLVHDAGDDKIPAVKTDRPKRGQNGSQKAKDAEVAREDDLEGATLGTDVPAMNFGVKTAAGTEVLKKQNYIPHPPRQIANGKKAGKKGPARTLGLEGNVLRSCIADLRTERWKTGSWSRIVCSVAANGARGTDGTRT